MARLVALQREHQDLRDTPWSADTDPDLINRRLEREAKLYAAGEEETFDRLTEEYRYLIRSMKIRAYSFAT